MANHMILRQSKKNQNSKEKKSLRKWRVRNENQNFCQKIRLRWKELVSQVSQNLETPSVWRELRLITFALKGLKAAET